MAFLLYGKYDKDPSKPQLVTTIDYYINSFKNHFGSKIYIDENNYTVYQGKYFWFTNAYHVNGGYEIGAVRLMPDPTREIKIVITSENLSKSITIKNDGKLYSLDPIDNQREIREIVEEEQNNGVYSYIHPQITVSYIGEKGQDADFAIYVRNVQNNDSVEQSLSTQSDLMNNSTYQIDYKYYVIILLLVVIIFICFKFLNR